MSELDGADPVKLLSSDGSVLITGTGAIDLRAASAGPLVTPFQMIPVPTDNTSSVVPVDFMTVPVVVTSAGDVLVDLDASLQITPGGGAGTFQIGGFTFLWDGAPLIDNAFDGFSSVGANLFNTIEFTMRLRTLIVGAPAGPHVLKVQWQVFDATCNIASFTGSGNLTVQTAPR